MTIACQQRYNTLINDELTLDEAEEAIDQIKAASKNTCAKIAAKIVTNLSIKFLNRHNANNQTQGEATLVIERKSLSIQNFLSDNEIARIVHSTINHFWAFRDDRLAYISMNIDYKCVSFLLFFFFHIPYIMKVFI